MGLTAQQLEQTFGTGFSPVKSITGFNGAALNRPSMPVVDKEVDACEQWHPVSISFNAGSGALKIEPNPGGEGIWIPYLGNGPGTPNAKGWGTFSKSIIDDTWVATGPFSGCYVAYFRGAGARFAHLITPAAGYRAASVDDQVDAIRKASGAGGETRYPMNGAGLGLAFFLKLGGLWHRRFVWVGPGGNVMQLNARSTPL